MIERDYMKGLKLSIISGGSSIDLERKFNRFTEEHGNSIVTDIKVTETTDSYTIWIFYEE